MKPRDDQPLLREGRNVWRLSKADRLAFLVDGAAYYEALATSLARARHSVLVAAWEIDDRTLLEPLADDPRSLADVLAGRLGECPSLQVHVLAWDFAMIYAVERGLQPIFRLRFSTPRRLHLHLDSRAFIQPDVQGIIDGQVPVFLYKADKAHF